jgi:hypothetical protein
MFIVFDAKQTGDWKYTQCYAILFFTELLQKSINWIISLSKIFNLVRTKALVQVELAVLKIWTILQLSGA